MSKVEGWIVGLRAEVVGVVRPSQSHHVWGRVVGCVQEGDARSSAIARPGQKDLRRLDYRRAAHKPASMKVRESSATE